MDLQDKRIFLIEDNIGNQTIAKTLLESHGAMVAIHHTGRDVIPHLDRFKPVDLIIIDLMLPSGVTGYDVLSDIRNSERYNAIPIIAMSVIDRSEAIPQAKQRGFSGFISKPIKFRNFPDQIAIAINGEELW